MWRGSGRNLTAAIYDLTTNLTYREGEIIKFYARKAIRLTLFSLPLSILH